MRRRGKRRDDFSIFDFPESDAQYPPTPKPRPVSRPPHRRHSVCIPSAAKGKLTSAERIKMITMHNSARLSNSHRLSLSQQRRQKSERKKAEAFRMILDRRKEDPDPNMVFDLTDETPLGAQARQPPQPDELVSDDDEDEDDSRLQPETMQTEVRRLFSSPKREKLLPRKEERSQSQKTTATEVMDVSDDESAKKSVKKRRVVRPRSRVSIPVHSSVFAPNVKKAMETHASDVNREHQTRRPLKTVNNSQSVASTLPEMYSTPEKETRTHNVSQRRSNFVSQHRSTNAKSRELVLNVSTIPRSPEAVEVFEISDDDSPASSQEENKTAGSYRSLKRPRHGKRDEKTISTTNFYGSKNTSRSTLLFPLDRILIPQLKVDKPDLVCNGIGKLSLGDHRLPKSPIRSEKIETPIVSQTVTRTILKPNGRILCDSTDDEDEPTSDKRVDIRFTPLSRDELEVVRSLTFKVSKQKVMAKIPEAKIELKAGDFSGLRGSRWLNDEIMNSFVSLLNSRNKRQVICKSAGVTERKETKIEDDDDIVEVAVTFTRPMEVFRRPRPRTHVLNTFFFARLSQGGYDYNGVRRWLKRAGRDVKELDLIMFPINLSNFHWVLGAVDLRGRQFLYLDSTYGKDSTGTIPLLRRWLHDEVVDKHGKKAAEDMDIDRWTIAVNPDYLPKQKDDGSCGIFTLYMAEYLERGQKPNFDQDSIRTLRQRTALFLKRGKLPDS